MTIDVSDEREIIKFFMRIGSQRHGGQIYPDYKGFVEKFIKHVAFMEHSGLGDSIKKHNDQEYYEEKVKRANQAKETLIKSGVCDEDGNLTEHGRSLVEYMERTALYKE